MISSQEQLRKIQVDKDEKNFKLIKLNEYTDCWLLYFLLWAFTIEKNHLITIVVKLHLSLVSWELKSIKRIHSARVCHCNALQEKKQFKFFDFMKPQKKIASKSLNAELNEKTKFCEFKTLVVTLSAVHAWSSIRVILSTALLWQFWSC